MTTATTEITATTVQAAEGVELSRLVELLVFGNKPPKTMSWRESVQPRPFATDGRLFEEMGDELRKRHGLQLSSTRRGLRTRWCGVSR